MVILGSNGPQWLPTEPTLSPERKIALFSQFLDLFESFCLSLAVIRSAFANNRFATVEPLEETTATTHYIKRRARSLAVLYKLIVRVALYLT